MKTARGRKPSWAVLQAQDNKGSPKLRKKAPRLPRPNDENHRPNESELRAQAHIAIAAGSMAVVYYWGPDRWYSMKTDTPGIWASLGKVVRELGELEPVLLAPPAPNPVQMLEDDDRVMTWTRVHDDELYVGLVNTDINAGAEVRFLPQGGSGPYRTVSGNGAMATENGSVNVRLGPAGVLVVAARANAAPATGLQ
jgi:hypothetical protein